MGAVTRERFMNVVALNLLICGSIYNRQHKRIGYSIYIGENTNGRAIFHYFLLEGI